MTGDSDIPQPRPVDANTPFENPELKDAIARFHAEPTNENIDLIIPELQKAHFIILTELQEVAEETPGVTPIKKGTKVGVINLYDKDKNCFHPLFTDWDAAYEFKPDAKSSFLVPAAAIWEHIMSDESYDGIIINPGLDQFKLMRPGVEYLYSQSL